MQSFLISTASVALAELGDKTQLLALVLAAKYRRPWLIPVGIFLAALPNHQIAGSCGTPSPVPATHPSAVKAQPGADRLAVTGDSHRRAHRRRLARAAERDWQPNQLKNRN